ncbi:MAG: hypothetical protein SFY68_00590 [Candidatus Sumerlaeia bacterium]|nr:hypothetical protein [Candidatus Sumerlaeia bacterium]
MSLGFGTHNIAYVPVGERLRIFDVMTWRILELDSTRIQVRLRSEYHETLKKELETIRKDLARSAETREISDADRATIRRFWKEATSAEPFPKAPVLKSIPFGDQSRLWVRLSSDPAESFFTEDYQESVQSPSDKAMIHRTYGSCHLKLHVEQEVPFANELEPAFDVQIPVDGFRVTQADPLKPLPLVEEFCGAEGNSSLGWSINLTVAAELAMSHQVCVPLREANEGLFQTLYFQFEQQREAGFLRRLSEKSAAAVERKLLNIGFRVETSEDRFVIYQRPGGDVIHLYRHLPGHELLGHAEMPWFLLVAQVGGSFDAVVRESLLVELVTPVAV